MMSAGPRPTGGSRPAPTRTRKKYLLSCAMAALDDLRHGFEGEDDDPFAGGGAEVGMQAADAYPEQILDQRLKQGASFLQ